MGMDKQAAVHRETDALLGIYYIVIYHKLYTEHECFLLDIVRSYSLQYKLILVLK